MCLFCSVNLNRPLITCERSNSTAFWAEPITALSTVAFFIAGWLSYRFLEKHKVTDTELLILPWLLMIVGAGSFTYHAGRSSGTLFLDAIPLYTFLLFAFFLNIRAICGGKFKAFLIVCALVALQLVIKVNVPREFLNGSISHIINVSFVCVIALLTIRKFGPSVKKPFLAVIGLYGLGIIFRNMDLGICSLFPYGTHFIWHILAAVAAYYAIQLQYYIKLEEKRLGQKKNGS